MAPLLHAMLTRRVFFLVLALAVAASDIVSSGSKLEPETPAQGSCSTSADAADAQAVSLLQTEMHVRRPLAVPELKRAPVLMDDSPGPKGISNAGDPASPAPVQPELAMPSAGYHPQTRAEVLAVTLNAEGDMLAFLAGLAVATFAICGCVVLFMLLHNRFPQVYCNNLASNPEPLNTIPPGSFGWVRAAWAVDTASVMKSAGLDQAMLIEFTNLSMRITAIIGLPMLFFAGSMNYFLGGHNAGQDHLSYFSFGNVVNGSKLYWIHAFMVWGVVFIVQANINAAQAKFLKYRFQWLRELPKARAHTILVEGIPDSYQSDQQLMEFFKTMFGSQKIASSYVVKKAPDLEKACAARDAMKDKLAHAQFKGSKADASPQDEDLVGNVADDVKRKDAHIRDLQKKVRDMSSSHVGPDGFNTSSGFVTFTNRTDAISALSMQYSEDADEWVVSTPPEANSVLWHDLQQGNNQATGLTVLGYLLIAGLFLAYMPSTIWITQIAVEIRMGPLQPLWQALAPTVGLQFMVAFLPTFLINIFRSCFTLKDDAWAQLYLQKWYFVFNMVFVILITAIGGSALQTIFKFARSPLDVFGVLGTSVPQATHFYMNYIVLQWISHFTVLLRAAPLSKYLFFRQIYDEKTALGMAEPEDQDYYGIGSRSCRMTTNLLIGIIYGTLCPPVLLVTFIEFLICRVIYGYLLPFAEGRKPDLGGAFWVQQLKHIFAGTIIYCLVMTGALIGRASSSGPGIIAGSSLIYVTWCMTKFERTHLWQKLPFKELVDSQAVDFQEHESPYVQPMLRS